MTRTKGAKNKNPYPINASTYNQRVNNVMRLYGTANNKIYNAVMKEQGMSPEQVEMLNEEKINIWKKFDTPSIMLMNEYAWFKTMVNAKMLKGDDPTSKDMRECLTLLLNIAKEINRLSVVSADKKFDAFTRSFSGSEEIELDMKNDVIVKDEEVDENGDGQDDADVGEEVQEVGDISSNIQDSKC